MSTRLIVLFFIVVVTALASCKNDDNVFTKTVSTSINVVNASSDNVNFYVNGTPAKQLLGFNTGRANILPYRPGPGQNFQIKKDGSPDFLINIPLNMKDSVYHSLYIAGESIDKTLYTIDTLLTDSGHVQLRFVHTTPAAGILDFKVGDTLKFHAPFKTSSSFLSVGSGLKEIKVFESGSSTPKIDTIISMSPNKGYTVFTKGALNGTGGSKFSLGVALNF